jgi:hypothetical protein
MQQNNIQVTSESAPKPKVALQKLNLLLSALVVLVGLLNAFLIFKITTHSGDEAKNTFLSEDIYAFAVFSQYADNPHHPAASKIYAMYNDGSKREVASFSDGELLDGKKFKSIDTDSARNMQFLNGKLYIKIDFYDYNEVDGLHAIDLRVDTPKDSLKKLFDERVFNYTVDHAVDFAIDDDYIFYLWMKGDFIRDDFMLYRYNMKTGANDSLNIPASSIARLDRSAKRICLTKLSSSNFTIDYFSVDYHAEDRQTWSETCRGEDASNQSLMQTRFMVAGQEVFIHSFNGLIKDGQTISLEQHNADGISSYKAVDTTEESIIFLEHMFVNQDIFVENYYEYNVKTSQLERIEFPEDGFRLNFIHPIE